MISRSAVLVLFSLLWMGCIDPGPSPTPPTPSADHISLEWAVQTNRVDDGTRFRSRLTIENRGEVPLPDTGWTLYNSPRSIDPESLPPSVRITHVNGDFYTLEPDQHFATVQPGERRAIEFEAALVPTSPWLDDDAPASWREAIAAAAVDRNGNESAPSTELVSRPDPFPGEVPSDANVPKPDVIARSTWAEVPSTGIEANAVRRNLSVGDTLRFRDLTVVLEGMIAGLPPKVRVGVLPDTLPPPRSSTPDTARLRLQRHDVQETRRLPEERALNWHGYHLGVLSANPLKEGLGGGLTELEVGTIASLSVDRASVSTTGDADRRLRVPHMIEHLTLHHTGSPEPLSPDDDPQAYLQGLHSWGGEVRNWWDVPYHYLIDLEGRIYEGRNPAFMGETNTTHDPRGHLLVSVMGNYDKQSPTRAQFESVADLLAWASARYDVPPDRLSGHDHWAETSCPGTHLRRWIETDRLQNAIQKRLTETPSE